MYCKQCGSQIDDNAKFCPSCGASMVQGPAPVQQDTANKAWGVLGFFFPLVGLILYLVWRTERPMDAKYAGRGALIGVIASVVLGILSGILWGVVAALIAASYAVVLPLFFL